MKRLIYGCLSALFVVSSTFAPTSADDGGISFGGSPHLLSGHPSVAMKSEAVKIDVHPDLISVDCKFVFHNSGPTCSVRVGFPDQGLGAEEPYQGEPLPTKGLKATFMTYESYIDGKKVPTKLVPTNDRGLFWHTKNVTFKGKGDCLVHDVYTLKPGSQVTDENGMYQQTSYVLHTGASWHGPIGEATITINFAPQVMPGPINLKSLASIPNQDISRLKWSMQPAGTVIYEGMCEPKLEGQTLRFFKENFKPTKKDDIHICYAYRKLTNMN